MNDTPKLLLILCFLFTCSAVWGQNQVMVDSICSMTEIKNTFSTYNERFRSNHKDLPEDFKLANVIYMQNNADLATLFNIKPDADTWLNYGDKAIRIVPLQQLIKDNSRLYLHFQKISVGKKAATFKFYTQSLIGVAADNENFIFEGVVRFRKEGNIWLVDNKKIKTLK